MKLRTILTGGLHEYLASEEYRSTEIIPITAQRVASHTANPRAASDDPALILAEEPDGNVLGFIGLLPDFLFEGTSKKVFWISCWWVHPQKGKSLGVPLLLSAYQATNGMLLADASPDTIQVFARTRLFLVPPPKKGLKIFFKPLLKDVLLRKKPSLARYRNLLNLTDTIISSFFNPVSLLRKTGKSTEKEAEVTGGSWAGNKELLLSKNLFSRLQPEIDWIISCPWVVQPTIYHEKRLYPFSSTAESFISHTLNFNYGGRIIACLFITERDKVAKLAYAHLVKGTEQKVALTLLNFLYSRNVNEFISFHEELNIILEKTRIPLAWKHRTSYQYIWGKPLGNLPLEQFQYGDGDAIFT